MSLLFFVATFYTGFMCSRYTCHFIASTILSSPFAYLIPIICFYFIYSLLFALKRCFVAIVSCTTIVTSCTRRCFPRHTNAFRGCNTIFTN